jgi:hypothetical protein
MPDVILRKLVASVEEIYHEGGPVADAPIKRASILAIIKNPFAGRYEEDIQGFMEDLRPLGLDMSKRLVQMLGGADQIQGYGKGAIIGEAGELEHVNASYVRSHFDAMEVGVNDAPRANEMALVLVMSTGSRVHSRSGGLEASEIKGEDGLR